MPSRPSASTFGVRPEASRTSRDLSVCSPASVASMPFAVAREGVDAAVRHDLDALVLECGLQLGRGLGVGSGGDLCDRCSRSSRASRSARRSARTRARRARRRRRAATPAPRRARARSRGRSSRRPRCPGSAGRPCGCRSRSRILSRGQLALADADGARIDEGRLARERRRSPRFVSTSASCPGRGEASPSTAAVRREVDCRVGQSDARAPQHACARRASARPRRGRPSWAEQATFGHDPPQRSRSMSATRAPCSRVALPAPSRAAGAGAQHDQVVAVCVHAWTVSSP